RSTTSEPTTATTRPAAAPTAPAPKPPPAPSAPTTVWAESPAERAAKTPADVWSTPSAAAPAPQTPAETTAAAQADDVEVEAAAARYLATRDPRAAELALEAARRYLKDGRTDAASDLLLQLIALLHGQIFKWNNALDVLIVAIFIYYVLVLIRGTRAVQLLIGVLVLVLIYWIATYLQLTLTVLLLQGLFAVAVVALVVVFQPELRRALGQLGQLGPLNRLLAPGTEEEVEGIVDELVRAALLISEAKHGALIVLERATGLQDYSETGVPVNG